MHRNFQTTSILLVLVALLVPIATAGSPEAVRTTFTVDGMHCDGCSSTITATLKKFDGVTEASADHEAGTAEVLYNPSKTEAEEFKTAIEKLGYTITDISTEVIES